MFRSATARSRQLCSVIEPDPAIVAAEHEIDQRV
jgi:hypothetical protein